MADDYEPLATAEEVDALLNAIGRSEQGTSAGPNEDIVTRLRNPDFGDIGEAMWGAADEIERLRRHRTAGETLAKAVATYCGDDAWADRALKTWQEARRG